MSSSGVPSPSGRRSSTVEDDGTPRPRWCAYRMFAAETSSVPGARRWVRDCLVRAKVEPDALALAELLVSELVTNAVRHARGLTVMVSVRTDENVEAAVRDDDVTPPVPRCPQPWEDSGRGLALVDALADAWGSCAAAGAGKWVWFRLGRDRDVRAEPVTPMGHRSGGGWPSRQPGYARMGGCAAAPPSAGWA